MAVCFDLVVLILMFNFPSLAHVLLSKSAISSPVYRSNSCDSFKTSELDLMSLNNTQTCYSTWPCFIQPAAMLLAMKRHSFCTLTGPRFRTQPGGFRVHKLLLLLLLVGRIETNPVPSRSVKLGCLNVNGANKKGALIMDLITDHDLDILAIFETKISVDAPNAIKYDVAPPGYGILHFHRGQGGPTNGIGLALAYALGVSLRSCKLPSKPTSFQVQLVTVKVGPSNVTLANIYRPPSGSKTTFLAELDNLISKPSPLDFIPISLLKSSSLILHKSFLDWQIFHFSTAFSLATSRMLGSLRY